jgi:hypothetical protein
MTHTIADNKAALNIARTLKTLQKTRTSTQQLLYRKDHFKAIPGNLKLRAFTISFSAGNRRVRLCNLHLAYQMVYLYDTNQVRAKAATPFALSIPSEDGGHFAKYCVTREPAFDIINAVDAKSRDSQRGQEVKQVCCPPIRKLNGPAFPRQIRKSERAASFSLIPWTTWCIIWNG